MGCSVLPHRINLRNFECLGRVDGEGVELATWEFVRC